jgi:choline dehydrogenase
MNGNRVHGVQFIDGKGSTKHVLARKDVILSAGSIKSPQILQLSGIGPSHVLEPLDVSKFKLNRFIIIFVLPIFNIRRYP